VAAVDVEVAAIRGENEVGVEFFAEEAREVRMLLLTSIEKAYQRAGIENGGPGSR
jgi:hypothetical protein